MYDKLILISIVYYGFMPDVQSTEGQQLAFEEIQDFSQADGFIFDGPAVKSSTNINDNLNGFKLSSISTSAPGTVFGRRKISHISTFEHCFKNCPSGKEVNPVCGNDGITYDNVKQVHCARMCGKYVQIKPCNYEATSETIIESKNFDSTLSICTNRCLSKSVQYNPVCGSDGITYENSEILTCVQTCGKQIKVASRGICTYKV